MNQVEIQDQVKPYLDINLMMVSLNKRSDFKLNESQESVPEGMMRVSGIFAILEKGQLNRNGREYDYDNYAHHVAELQKKIDQGLGIFGELEHPKGMQIDNNNISHKIESISFDKKTGTVSGTLLLLDTPKGLIAQSIIRSGGAVRVSSRASGYMKGTKAFINNLVTYDIVGSPSFTNTQLWLTESIKELKPIVPDFTNLLESYYDKKAVNSGLWISENGELIETDLFESCFTPLNENELKENQTNIINTTNNNTMNTEEIKSFLESEEGQGFLRTAFAKFLIEAEEAAPVEDVINTRINESILEAKDIIGAGVEKFIVESYTPTLLNFVKNNQLNESAQTFSEFVQIVNENEIEAANYLDQLNEAYEGIAETDHNALGLITESIEEMNELTESLSDEEKVIRFGKLYSTTSKLVSSINESTQLNESEDDEAKEENEEVINESLETLYNLLNEAKEENEDDEEEGEEKAPEDEGKDEGDKPKEEKAPEEGEKDGEETSEEDKKDDKEKPKEDEGKDEGDKPKEEKAPEEGEEKPKEEPKGEVPKNHEGKKLDKTRLAEGEKAPEEGEEKPKEEQTPEEGEKLNESSNQKPVSLLESLKNKFAASKNKSAVNEPINESTDTLLDETVNTIPTYLQYIPENFKTLYENLTESQKAILERQANTRLIESKDDAEQFWYSRNFGEITNKTNVTLNESNASVNGSNLANNLAAVCKRLQ